MNLFIACPVYQAEHPAHLAARDATVRHFAGSAVYHRLPGDSSLARARAALFGVYLQRERPWTHFLQVDDDISWNPEHIETMIGLNYPILGGLCAFKSDRPAYAGRTTTRFLSDPQKIASDGTVPVQYCGGGFILWRDDVLRSLCAAYPELQFRTNPGEGESVNTFNLWACGLVDRPDWGSREFLTEDYWICHLARELGYEPRAHVRFAMPHWKGETPFLPRGFHMEEKAA